MANTHTLLATPWRDEWQILIPFLLPHGWRDGKYSYPSCYPMDGGMANTHTLLATPWRDVKYSYPSCYPMDGGMANTHTLLATPWMEGWQILIPFLLPHGGMSNTHTLLATPWRDGKGQISRCCTSQPQCKVCCSTRKCQSPSIPFKEEWKDMLGYAEQYLDTVKEDGLTIWWKLFNSAYAKKWPNISTRRASLLLLNV